MKIKVGGKDQKLTWEDIQERINWLLNSNISFERTTLDGPAPANRYGKSYVVVFYFDTISDAMLFKLAWGGRYS